jgi:ABC-2 type transport system permease protein
MPTLLIPLFFLVVNIGQAGRVSPPATRRSSTGRATPRSSCRRRLLLSASFGMSALYLTEEIEGGYFDKLRATPISRVSLVLGRLYAEVVKPVALTAVMIAVALLFDVRIRSGVPGFPVLLAIGGLWAAVFSGFMQLVSLKTRSAAATRGRAWCSSRCCSSPRTSCLRTC